MEGVTLTTLLKLVVEVGIADDVIDTSLVIVALTESDDCKDKLITEDGDGNNAVIDTDGEIIPVNVALKDRLIILLTVAITLSLATEVKESPVLKVIEGKEDPDIVDDTTGETLGEPVLDSVTDIVESTDVVKDDRGVTLDDDDIDTDCVLTDEEVSDAVLLEYIVVVGIAESDTEKVVDVDGVPLNLLVDDTRGVIDRNGDNDALVDDKGVDVKISEIDFRTLGVTDTLTRLVPLFELQLVDVDVKIDVIIDDIEIWGVCDTSIALIEEIGEFVENNESVNMALVVGAGAVGET